MTPTEKAEIALNHRLEQLQVELKEAKSESAQRVLFQSLLVCLGIGEALRDYIKAIGTYAQGRHAEIKQEQVTLTVRHEELLKSGNELLELFKANPGDKVIRKELDRFQQDMETIQKTLRRGANALQRDVAPALGTIDKLADAIKRFGEATQIDALKRVIKLVVGQAHEFYRAHPGLPEGDFIDTEDWEKSAFSQIDAATDFHEAHARAGNQVMLAIDLMMLAVSSAPPQTPADALRRANEVLNGRLKGITQRLGGSGPG